MTDWTKALCRKVPDAERIFFSFKTDDIEMSKVVCSHCPIAQDCLEYALARESGSKDMSAGIYGGTDPVERALMQGRTCRDCSAGIDPKRTYCVTCAADRKRERDRKTYGGQCLDCKAPTTRGKRCLSCASRVARQASLEARRRKKAAA